MVTPGYDMIGLPPAAAEKCRTDWLWWRDRPLPTGEWAESTPFPKHSPLAFRILPTVDECDAHSKDHPNGSDQVNAAQTALLLEGGGTRLHDRTSGGRSTSTSDSAR